MEVLLQGALCGWLWRWSWQGLWGMIMGSLGAGKVGGSCTCSEACLLPEVRPHSPPWGLWLEESVDTFTSSCLVFSPPLHSQFPLFRRAGYFVILWTPGKHICPLFHCSLTPILLVIRFCMTGSCLSLGFSITVILRRTSPNLQTAATTTSQRALTHALASFVHSITYPYWKLCNLLTVCVAQVLRVYPALAPNTLMICCRCSINIFLEKNEQ